MYALSLSDDCRILSVTYAKYASPDDVRVDELPEGDVYNYRYIEGEYIYDPVVVDELETPSQLDRIEAQVTYTAMMTDTLLEV